MSNECICPKHKCHLCSKDTSLPEDIDIKDNRLICNNCLNPAPQPESTKRRVGRPKAIDKELTPKALRAEYRQRFLERVRLGLTKPRKQAE